MRKAHMQVVIDHLRKANEDLTAERDHLKDTLHAKADAAHAAIGKLGDDISDLAGTVRAAVMPPAAPAEPEPTPEPAEPVTPIASKRRTKAAG